MYCRRCGHQLPDDAQYCDRCGTATQDNAPAAAQPQNPGCLWRITHGLAWLYLICILALIGVAVYVVISAYQPRDMGIQPGGVSTVDLSDLKLNYSLDAGETGQAVEGQRIRVQGFCVARGYLDSGTIALGLNTNGTDHIDLYVECPADQRAAAEGLQRNDLMTIACTIVGYDAEEEMILANQGAIE